VPPEVRGRAVAWRRVGGGADAGAPVSLPPDLCRVNVDATR